MNMIGFDKTYDLEDGVLIRHGSDGDDYITRTAIEPLAMVIDSETDTQSLLVAVKNIDGEERVLRIPYSDLVSNVNRAVSVLSDAGLVIVPGKEKALAIFLRMAIPPKRLVKTSQSGWSNDNKCFVLPDETFGDLGEKEVCFEPKSKSLAKGYKRQGTTKQWRVNVGNMAKGNPLMIFVICVSLCGPLLKLAGFNGGGVHLYGRSSRGKTTLSQLAASIWGNGTDPSVPTDDTLVRTWYTTVNAIDALSEAHSDTLLPMDELGTFIGRDLGKVIYQLAGGQEKASLTSTRTFRDGATWRGNILSTGEISVLQKIQSTGGKAMAGQLVRMLDIPIGDVFTETGDLRTGEFANKVKSNCSKYYGSVGRDFLSELVDWYQADPSGAVELLIENVESITNELRTDDVSPEQERALRRLALYQVAGEFAVHWGILKFKESRIADAIVHVRDLWLQGGVELSDTSRAIDTLRFFIGRSHGGFASIGDADPGGNIKGYRSRDRQTFYFDDDQLSAACGGREAKEVAKELRSRGLLLTNEEGRLKVKQKIASLQTSLRFYAVKAAILNLGEDDGSTADTDSGEEDDLFDLTEEAGC